MADAAKPKDLDGIRNVFDIETLGSDISDLFYIKEVGEGTAKKILLALLKWFQPRWQKEAGFQKVLTEEMDLVEDRIVNLPSVMSFGAVENASEAFKFDIRRAMAEEVPRLEARKAELKTKLGVVDLMKLLASDSLNVVESLKKINDLEASLPDNYMEEEARSLHARGENSVNGHAEGRNPCNLHPSLVEVPQLVPQTPSPAELAPEGGGTSVEVSLDDPARLAGS